LKPCAGVATTTTPQDGLTRAGLDVALLIAEAEPVSGLPDWPSDLPPGPEPPPAGFKLRRVESMCVAHTAAVAEAHTRLELLKVGRAVSHRQAAFGM
jgi:hypothetical protein